MAAKPALPKRFQPLQSQAETEADIRYGAQGSALQSLYDQATHDYQRNLAAQSTATMGLLGALQGAPAQIKAAYSDAGLTPNVLATIGNSPTGQRIASELASALGGVQQQATGARAGAVYQLGNLTDQYQQDVGKLNDQSTALGKERGEFTSNLLDQLIGSDRSTRHDENTHVKDQQFTADQNAITQGSELTRTIAGGLIGQGIAPVIGQDGSVSAGGPIPGAKANKPAAKPKATPIEQSTGGSEFGRAVKLAKQLKGNDPNSPQLRNKLGQMLTSGRAGTKGQPIYETVTDPNTHKTHQQKVLNPDGTPKTTKGTQEVKPVDDVVASSALDMVFDGYVSTHNVKRLHDLGYTVRDFPGLKTQFETARQRAQHPYVMPARPTQQTRATQPG